MNIQLRLDAAILRATERVDALTRALQAQPGTLDDRWTDAAWRKTCEQFKRARARLAALQRERLGGCRP